MVSASCGHLRIRRAEGKESILALCVDGLHRLFGVSRSSGGALGRDTLDVTQFILRQRDIQRAEVFLEELPALRSRDRNDVLALRQQPGERELRWRATLLAREVLDAAHQVEVLLEVLSLESGIDAAIVVRRQVLERPEAAGEKPATQRTVRDESDAELSTRREQFVFRIATP